MNDWKNLGRLSVVALAVFALAGCGRANAQRGQAQNQSRATTSASAVSDARPTSDAEADNGPGCAESALNGASHQASRK